MSNIDTSASAVRSIARAYEQAASDMEADDPARADIARHDAAVLLALLRERDEARACAAESAEIMRRQRERLEKERDDARAALERIDDITRNVSGHGWMSVASHAQSTARAALARNNNKLR